MAKAPLQPVRLVALQFRTAAEFSVAHGNNRAEPIRIAPSCMSLLNHLSYSQLQLDLLEALAREACAVMPACTNTGTYDHDHDHER